MRFRLDSRPYVFCQIILYLYVLNWFLIAFREGFSEVCLAK
ncbi:hypothetical protein Sps_00252 [Shewanella psychrophila]|uniref:Uncharacterized protein n=1 Tax=Shewanella psychrophila TaxID=225848 RepID=A0A1S6HIX4_9GAMM|nr:hypothetical protein Sps_00252 [Shewanella psychrophila]